MNDTQTHISFMGALCTVGDVAPVNSKPSPPNRNMLPELSVHPAAPYRVPGVLVRGFGVGVVPVGALAGNAPYCGVPSKPAVLPPSIHVQSLWPQSTTMFVTFAVTTPL